MKKIVITIFLGFSLGILLIKSQAFSWYRIQEMFHFKSFHMYGLLFSAILTAAVSLVLIKKFNIKSMNGNEIRVKPKKIDWRSNIIGGLVFGLGWSISGACTAPVYILSGMFGVVGFILLFGAILGTLLYAFYHQKKLNS